MNRTDWFAGKTVLITGASQGIGRALAVHFAGLGATVLAAARNQDGLAETGRLASGLPGACAAYRLDLADVASVTGMVEALERDGHEVDILVNNAANVTSKPFLDSSLDEIDQQVRTNVTGMLQITRLVTPAMVSRNEGVVVNISSLAGYKPNTSQTVYGITKAAVNGASEALFAELRSRGVHVLNMPLPPIGDHPGQAPVARVAAALEEAIVARKPEVFLHRRSKWLMRLYRAWPALSRLR
ncbi:MAG: SDR family oxidoreductase [bacterium]|nr:SDR family oxidoreductase [bacterium]